MQTPAPTPTQTPDATPAPEPVKVIPQLNIVSTIFPQYDWVREILGDEAEHHELTLLIDNRVDLHSFQPSVSDIVKIGASDLFIHVGGVSDEWVENLLRQATNPNMVVINLLDVLGDAVKMVEELEGPGEESHGHTCSSHGHSHANEDDCDDDDCDDHEDEHVWLSLRNAKVICAAIAGALAALNPESADDYQDNLNAYTIKLDALDAEYQAVTNTAEVKTLLFADRFPFRYLMDEYGLNYYAAFSGCSAETEASFRTIVFLAQKIDELGLNSVMVTETSDQSIARTVVGSTAAQNQRILVLDGMKAVTRSDINNGITYLSVMENNLKVLREALN
jgi:zinc transport system substrate-binding protein